MGLFTIDRTINFEEGKVKKVLEIIADSSDDEVLENKMVANSIVRLQEGTPPHGFFRRRWVTFLKEFGLYDGNKITEIGNLFRKDLLSTKELVLLVLVNRVVTKNGEKIRPFEILLKISKKLEEKIGTTRITEEDLTYAVSKASTDENSIIIAVNTIINARKNNKGYSEEIKGEPCHFDIWRNLLKTADINNSNNEIEIDLECEIIKYIIEFYNENSALESDLNCFNNSFINSIKLPRKVNDNDEILLKRQNYKDYYSEIIYKYLFEMSINVIEQDVLNANENGNIPYKILNGFNISTSRTEKPSNMKLYSAFKGYEGIIINKLRKTGDSIYSFIASSIKNYLDDTFNEESNVDNGNPITIFKEYYFSKLSQIKEDKKENESIIARDEFKSEYPIERIKQLEIDEYALGTENYKETLSYKLEFGKYRHAGPGIGGATASKHGFYKKDDQNYYGIKNEKIENPVEYWENFRGQLTDFLSECSVITQPLRASQKYPLLQGMSMVLTKMLCIYYPSKFVNICSKEKLIKLLKYFGYSYEPNMKAEELSFILNKNIRKDIVELNDNEPQYLGSIMWDFINEETDAVDEMEEDEVLNSDLILIDSDRNVNGYNKIVYGIPGCGKSYYVMHNIISNDEKHGKVYRTTFYPDYTNGDFVGQVIPKLNYKDETSVLYDIQTGPFTDALLEAILNPNQNIYLVIEEINRGNAAAIFGDLFQLLDRNLEGESEYPINNYIISTYLHKKIDNKYSVNYDLENIKIPSNLTIIGTMNTSDQNVFTLDTAFKRRWKMEYIQNNIDESEYANELIPLSNVTWAEFVKEINDYITGESGLDINGEDKQIGAYFISSSEWNDIKTTKDPKEAAKIFAEKVLSYIWEDVAKINRESWFDGNKYRTLDTLVKGFTEKGLEVFNDNISFTRAEQNNNGNE